MPQRRIFVSATTRGLERYRRLAIESLRKRGYEVDDQAVFNLTFLEINEKVRQRIEACDAVVSLIGFAYGRCSKALPTALAEGSMSDAWDFYFANVNGVIASLFVDLGVRDSVPDPERPWMLWTWVYFRQPRADGLSSSKESAVLYEIEDALTCAVKQTTQAELVGRITTAGHREFYFYGAQPDGFKEAVLSALKRFPEYEFDSGAKQDHEWSQYLNVLYPSPEDHQRIKNRHVVEALERHGDLLERPRPVWHWAYFKSPGDRSRFIAKAASAGFKITDESSRDDSDAEYPFGVTLERIDRVDWDSINQATLELFWLAQETSGNYDGWETSVEKE